MEGVVSPKYLVKLVDKINEVIWQEVGGYKKVLFYIKRWQEHGDENDFNNYWENFRIHYNDGGKIDLLQTIEGMTDEIILKIAIDLGIDTPDFLPAIPVFKNDLKENYKTAFESFEKALKQIEDNPDLAVGLANSTLESIIKHILSDENLSKKLDKSKTLYDLTGDILSEFKMYPLKEAQKEIKVIGSSLLNASKHIEELRSNKTMSHGKMEEDYVINDSLYAYFIVNSISTIGIFLISFYNKKYKKFIEESEKNKVKVEDIRIDDIQF